MPDILPDIPALSIRQPWAWLIVNGIKDVENRTWRTTFRGEFLVHAGRNIDIVSLACLKHDHPEIKFPTDFDAGGIVGKATLVDCVATSSSPWFEGYFGYVGFVLANASPLPFTPGPGRLKFFRFVPAKL